jgi:hypothetical protein
MKPFTTFWLFSAVTASEYKEILDATKNLKLDDTGPELNQPQIKALALTTPLIDKQASGPRARKVNAAKAGQHSLRLIQTLYSEELTMQFRATTRLRKILGIKLGSPIKKVIKSGVVPRLVEILAGKSAQVAENDEEEQQLLQETQIGAAWALVDIASGTSDETMAVVEAEAIPVLIELMNHPNEEICMPCVWALGNIAGDGPKLRDRILQAGMMLPLLKRITRALDQKVQPNSTVRDGAWVIKNFCYRNPAPSWSQISASLQVLLRLLQVKDDETLVNCARALAYMAGRDEVISDLIDSGVIPHLIPLLGYPNASVQILALRAIDKIMAGAGQGSTQLIVDADGLALLSNLMDHTDVSTVGRTCRVISKIAAGTPGQTQVVLDVNIVPKLVKLLVSDDYRVKREICQALSNATIHHKTHPNQTKYLVSQGVIKSLCCFLGNSQDQRVVLVALNGLANILAVGKQEASLNSLNSNPYALLTEEALGVDIIRQLRHYSDLEINSKAKDIINEYYEDDADENSEGEQILEFYAANIPKKGPKFACVEH